MPTSSPFTQASAAPQAASDTAMNALYSAALGPVQLPRYLALFERFDQAGRAPAGWNLAAGLATLNWMVLHHLWNAALVYVALVEGLALLVFGIGRPLLHWPEQIEWGLFAAFAMFAIVLPGLFGDALLHRELRKRIAHALVAAHTIPEAHMLLARQASSWRRLAWIAAANVLLFAAIALTWALAPTGGGNMPGTAAEQVATGPVQAAAPHAPDVSHTAATASPALPTTTAASHDVPTPEVENLDKVLAPPPPPLLAQHNAQTQEATPPHAPASTEPAPNSLPKATPNSATASTPAASTSKASDTPRAHAAGKHDAQPVAVRSAPAAKRAAASTSTTAPADKATPAPKPAASTPALVGSTPGYYLNVGMFAEEANARRAQAKLLNASLPAFRQTFATQNGERTRVRVGPFASPAEAQKAASQIRSMQLDAVMYRQH